MRRQNWIKNKKIDRFKIGQRYQLKISQDHLRKIDNIKIIEITKVSGSFCDVINVLNHSHIAIYSKEEIMRLYEIVEKKPIKTSNGKIRKIDLSQS